MTPLYTARVCVTLKLFSTVDCYLFLFSPNTYRVISGEAEQILVQRPRKPSEVFTPDVNTIGQLPDVKLPSPYDHRQNRPNETHVGFLNSDVRILNAPICDVYTKRTQDEQPLWWPHRNDGEKLKAPGHPLDSTCRYDYQYRGNEVRGSTRHSSNPNKSPALGSGKFSLTLFVRYWVVP